jgi:ubiquinone/menaquinone biosynthesis C-methylase UbiE
MNKVCATGSSQTIAATDKVFAGSIPEVYERHLVPLIFDAYARDLAQRVAQERPQRVLEVAAGTGALTRWLVSCLPAQVRIVATDLNQAMLGHAARRLGGDSRVAWRQADALALPFEDQAFDAVACQFGVMFFPDKVQAYREMLRVLKRGGHLLFNVWDDIAANAFADVVTQALAQAFPQDPPMFLARIPHGYHDRAAIEEALRAAGFASVSIETRADLSRAPSALDAAVAYCQGTPLRHEIEVRDAARLEEATQAAAGLLARRFGSGAIEGGIRAHVVGAIRP